MSAQLDVGTVVLTASLVVLGTVGILTNAALIFFYVRRPIMRTSTNVFMVHKALPDLISLLPVPLRLLEILSGEDGWSSSGWMCKFVVTVETLCMIVSANIVFALAYDRLTAVTKPGDGLERTVTKARNHVAAAWVYSLLLALPVAAASWVVVWPPGNSFKQPTCGYRWPAGEMYHSMYFGSLLVIIFALHYVFYACFAYLTWKRVRQSKEEFLARHDTLQRCCAVAGIICLNFIAYFVYWAQHVYIMVSLGEDQTHVPHIPSSLTDPLSIAASVAVYVAASSNLLIYSSCMDQWRSVARDALRCRCGAGGGVRPVNGEDAVAVIDVTAATDEPQSNIGHLNRDDDNDNHSIINLANPQQSDEEMDVQEIAL
ncbi:somatostatin receptor type 5-like [Patiria miniata]|uniref:G-protein coupled receptors family 1 profile domain-containing protein n=1 Tax=Patiria miniata TaxID=46514 RepID=A0A914ATJ0_PATMI|nr:somatostatin receptor type 5-like [Patiria miniata]